MTDKQLLCPYCHSPDITIDANATWSIQAQEWQLSSTHDVMTCEACGQEFREAWEQPVADLPLPENRATPEEIERACEIWCFGSDDELEIDDNAKASRTDDGLWVAAWVWLPNEVDG